MTRTTEIIAAALNGRLHHSAWASVLTVHSGIAGRRSRIEVMPTAYE